VKRVSAALGLTALAAAAALAQQPPATQPPASTSSQQQSQTAAPDQGASRKPDTQTLMRNCLKQMQATNAPAQDIKDYCEKKVKSQTED